MAGYFRSLGRAIFGRYNVETSSRTFKRKTETRGPNSATRTAPRSLRELMREKEQNEDLVNTALAVQVANIIGNGLVPQPMVKTKSGDLAVEVNAQITKLWSQWAKRPEVTWCYNEAHSQRLSCRTWLRDGEVLNKHIIGPSSAKAHANDAIPYSYEMLEPDFLPDVLDTSLTSSPGAGNRIVNGIEVNGWNRPVAYHLYRDQPNDTDLGMRAFRSQHDTVRVSADIVSHIKHTTRINQLRGVTPYAAAIKRIDDLINIDETERVAARIAAAAAFAIKRGSPDMFSPDNTSDVGEFEVKPGFIFDLEEGEEVQSLTSNRPNNALIPFRAAQIRSIAGVVGISYSSLSKDYDGSYSSQRQELVEQHMLYTPSWSYWVMASEVPKYENVVRVLDLTRQLDLSADVDRATLFDVEYTQPAMPWIDPLKEAKGWAEALKINVATREDIIRGRGKNPAEVSRQRDLELAQDAERQPQQPQPGEPTPGEQPEE